MMAEQESRAGLGFGGFKARMASGTLALIPIVVTVLFLRVFFSFTAGILLPIVDPAVADWPVAWRAALSFGILLAVVYVLGALATHVVGRRVLALGDALMLRVPFVKVIYSASKQVVTALGNRKSGAFKSVVLLEFPTPGMRAVGFVTSTVHREDGAWSTVFVPTTPNPTTGFLQIVPAADLIETGMSVEDGIKLVMSLGVVGPEAVVRVA